MMQLFGDSPALDDYVAAHSTPVGSLLDELEAATRASLTSPGMLAGPVVAALLRFLVGLLPARLVLEIGTYSGYSTLAMASALPEDGRLITCELSEERSAFARSWFRRSPHGARIEQRVGPALDTIATLDGSFDLVFIDADKEGYRGYYDAVVPKLSARGVIAADNTLRSGSVLDPDDDVARAMAAFNEHVQADSRTENVILTVRDGLTLIRRR
jgi:predicted O-methyltransferase YrrM